MSPDIVSIRSEDGRTCASFAPDAGMVCCSLTIDDRELLDPRRGLSTYAQAGKTMGIPLLYPWANRLQDWGYSAAGREVRLPADPRLVPSEEHGLPIHGVIPGLMRWRSQPSGATLRGRLAWDSPQLLKLFPFRHEVLLEAVAETSRLTLTVTVSASATDQVPVSFGFHPYLRLPGPREQCIAELPFSRRLTLDAQSIPTGEREAPSGGTFALEGSDWDDGLELASSPARFTVSAGAHRCGVELLEGFPYGQVFAPEGHDFICFEPMTAPANALRSGDGLRILCPGEQHRARFAIFAAER